MPKESQEPNEGMMRTLNKLFYDNAFGGNATLEGYDVDENEATLSINVIFTERQLKGLSPMYNEYAENLVKIEIVPLQEDSESTHTIKITGGEKKIEGFLAILRLR